MAETGVSFWRGVALDFSTRAFVLIPVAIGLNVIGGTFTRVLRLPLFLDVIGTILLAIIAGPWVAVVAGASTNLILGVTTSPSTAFFAVVQIAIALVAGWMATSGWFMDVSDTRDYARLFLAGVILAIVSTLTATPIQVIVLGGFSGAGQDAAVGALMATGSSIVEAVFATQFTIDITDKLISLGVAYGVARQIPERYLPSFGQQVLNE
ncbi:MULTISPECIES: ECF transporter S component [Haloarcula]|uniref:ECF transporter S component n=1 Tax=Haloarcula TaxID=2237 RepID=UPI0023EC3C1C|nr:ECF transporter S component [Halomicroarcula sp. XH51]